MNEVIYCVLFSCFVISRFTAGSVSKDIHVFLNSVQIQISNGCFVLYIVFLRKASFF